MMILLDLPSVTLSVDDGAPPLLQFLDSYLKYSNDGHSIWKLSKTVSFVF